MADPSAMELTTCLKTFAQKLTNCSLNEKKLIFGNLSECIGQTELPDKALHGIMKCLLLTLSRYHDKASRQLVVSLVCVIGDNQPEKCLAVLCTVVKPYEEWLKKQVTPCRGRSADALAVLTWSCSLLSKVLKAFPEKSAIVVNQLVGVQSSLVCTALEARHTGIAATAYRRMVAIWKEFPSSVPQYSEALGGSEAEAEYMCLVGMYMRYLATCKNVEQIQASKSSFLELYVKLIIGSRAKPKKQWLESSKNLLRHVTHDDFKTDILPAAQKAMLRNPEIFLEGFSEMIAGLTLDMSQYVKDIGKLIGIHLVSKDENMRQEGQRAIINLARQCSDSGAVETLVTQMFALFNGSEGKLTLIEQKLSVIQSLGNLSNNSVNGTASVQSLSDTVVEKFLPLLQQEVQETTLVQAVMMMALWCNKFTTAVPDKLTEWFKKAMTLKTSTSSVRNAYINCMLSSYHGDTLFTGMQLIPLLLSVLEKASSQTSQPQLVTEALSSMCVLIRFSLLQIEAEAKLVPFWSVLLDADKQMVFSEKFLTSVTSDTLHNVVRLAERLLLDHPQKLSDNMASFVYRALVYCLTRPCWKLRRRAGSCIHHATGLLGGCHIALALLDHFNILLQSEQVTSCEQDLDGATESTSRYIQPRILTQAVEVIAFVDKVSVADGKCLALKSLLPSHHPCIVAFKSELWINILRKLQVHPEHFVSNNVSDCLKVISQDRTVSESLHNIIKTLVFISPEAIIPALFAIVSAELEKTAITQVTMDEFNIFNTPEGEIYDKSVMESVKKIDVKQTNIKRENKLYSYADQMAEIELRKELEKKKGKGKAEVKQKLTKKQEEILEAQRQKESAIRSRIQLLHTDICYACSLLRAIISGNCEYAVHDITKICRVIVPLMQSNLAATEACRVFVDLGSAAFKDADLKQLGDYVSHCSLRLLNSECVLDPGWNEEPLEKQVNRLIAHIASITADKKSSLIDDDMDSEPVHHLLPASCFAFLYHLFNSILLTDTNSNVTLLEPVKMQTLKIITHHAQMRNNNPEDEGRYDPGWLPLKELFSLLIKILSTTTGHLQNLSLAAILEVSDCAGGGKGCTNASKDDLQVFTEALQSPCVAVRDAVLRCLLRLVNALLPVLTDYEFGLKMTQRIWVAVFDPEEDIKELAIELQTLCGLEDPYDELCTSLIEDTVHHEEVVRKSSAYALAEVIKHNPDSMEVVVQTLLDKYEEKLFRPPPALDQFGRIISDSVPDDWPARCGIGMAMAQIAPHLKHEQIVQLFEFFVPRGLGDRDEHVRNQMREAALAVINSHGTDAVSDLLPVLEEFLASAPDSAGNDAVRQSVVILLGSLAKHLDKDNPKIKPIVAKLIGALSTPSQQVQDAVANCLPPLVSAIKDDAQELVQRLLQLLLESDNYGERKGAAYGLAGLIKGLGIVTLKQLDIMTKLTEAIQDKKNPRHREGALFAFEMLCSMLGKLFEPYVVHVLPHLLLCFGDNSAHVRDAADDTARAVMSKLSAHGVKLVLPSLLKALEEESWRTKTGSVELLGAMAFCAPKQLSACLPSIVPKLSEVITDSHHRVQNAGAQALKQIGSVIRNPEIQAIVPVLLEALQEPSRCTTTCLQTLLETQFIHFIDAPSLALIMPVVQRACQDRSTETRKMAAQIIGNMYSLTDQKDLSPYLPTVIPGLKQSLMDPVPEVRTVSARALGAIVKGMGEAGFEDLVPWLMMTLTSEASAVDRSGAAQGLSEVIGGMGLEKLHKLMPDIIQTAERNDIATHVRDGYLMMYIYLPTTFGSNFVPFVGPIINSILKGLADESEFVRETAMRAGQRIINLYSDTAIELLLPELENGLFDDSWRIRASSIQLLGDLLYKISGVSGKMSTESAGDDDNFGTENSQQTILRALGSSRFNRVLAGLYMGRSDVALMVRQSALHVWKIIISNTPRTLREILPTLFQLLLGCLASPIYDKRQIAARTLGDLVKKLGERVLPEIIPVLERGLDSKESQQRQGVCIGLSEIMAATSRDHVLVFADSLIPAVRRALCDHLPEVREAAAKTFDNLHANIGQRALDDILLDLLQKLHNPKLREFALDGLKQVMSVKSRVVMPYLVPQLTAPPVNTEALALLSSVAGDSLTRHLNRILPALLTALSHSAGTPNQQQELEYCQSVVLSVSDDAGVRNVMEELLSFTSTQRADIAVGMQCAAVTILNAFCQQTKADYSDYLPQLFRGLIGLCASTDESLLLATWECLNTITKKLDVAEMLHHITHVRQAVKFASLDTKGQELPGFSLPKKGIAPLLPIFREGILNGSADMKESAAIGLGEIIKLTNADALKPSVLNITGPLIRILGDRFTFNVKVALLDTLTLLLAKVGVMLKPFLPQLQTTFIKALNDPNRSVRLKAAAALGKLVIIHMRVDALFTDILTGIKNVESKAFDDPNANSVRETNLQALRDCLSNAGTRMTEPLRKQVLNTLLSMLNDNKDSTRCAVAACLGALCKALSEEELVQLLIQNLLDNDMSTDWTIRHGNSVALAVALKESPGKILGDSRLGDVQTTLLRSTSSDRVAIILAGMRGIGYLIRYQLTEQQKPSNNIIQAVVKGMKHDSNDVKLLSAQIVHFLCWSLQGALPEYLVLSLLPMLISGTKEKNTAVRSSSEHAMLEALRLRQKDDFYKNLLSGLDGGLKDTVRDVHSKTLSKLAMCLPPTGTQDIDDTMLT